MTLRCFLLLLISSAVFAAVAHESRVHDQKLSDKEPGSPEYDHEAFLGKDEADEFDQLSPEESRRRLKIIVDKMDKNGDKKITEEELKNWITFTQNRYIEEDTRKQFEQHDTDQDRKINWEEYRKSTYGYLDDGEHEDTEEYKKMMDRDKARFETADADGNGECTFEEFRAFLHPEEFPRMKDVVTKETLNEIDKDGDGFVSLEEYIGDLTSEDDSEEPDWVATEREQFKSYRDQNHDGKLDLEEVKAWIMPEDYNHADAEARHLVYEADDDKDGELSKDEIVNHHDKFVGSQATDWGEALKRHDEF